MDKTDLQNQLRQAEQEEEQEEQTPFTDVYDLYRHATKIHSPIPEVTDDFTMSQLSDHVIDSRPTAFVRDQIKICKVINTFITHRREAPENIPKIIGRNGLDTQASERYKERIKEKMREEKSLVKTWKQETVNTLLSDVYVTTIMSRAEGGKIINGIIDMSKQSPTEEKQETETGALQKIKNALLRKKSN